MANWETSASILFRSNGVDLFRRLTDAANKFIGTMSAVTTAADDAGAAFERMGAAADRCAASVDVMSAASNESASASDRAAAGASRTSAAYDRTTASATRAQRAILALSAVSAAGASLTPPRMLGPGTTGGAITTIGEDALPYVVGRGQSGGGQRALPPGSYAPAIPNVTPRNAYPIGGPGGPGGPGQPPTGGGGARPTGPSKFNYGAVGSAATTAFGFTQHAAAVGAELGLGLATDAMVEAGKLQQQMSIIRIASPGLMAATKDNDAFMGRVQEEAYNISNATAQSVAQSAQVMGVLASSGLTAQQFMQKGANGETLAMDVAKYADVQFLKTGGKVSFEEGAKQAIKLSHLYGAYTPQQIVPILDAVTKSSFMQPDSVSKMLTQSGYYTKLFTRFGVPQDQTLLLGAWLDRQGGGTKGGTWLQQLLLQTQKPINVSEHVQSARKKALEYFGLEKDGKPDPTIFGFDPKTGKPVTQMFNKEGTGLLQRFNEIIQRDRNAASTPQAKAAAERLDIQKFNVALGLQGERIPLLADQQGVDQLLTMVQELNHLPGVDAAQSMLMRNFDSTTTRAWSNFQSLITEVGQQAIPGMTKGLGDLADALHNGQHWLHEHKDLEMQIQRWVTSTVKTTEQFLVEHQGDIKAVFVDVKKGFGYLVDHRKDFAEIAGDINVLIGAVSKMGPVIKWTADAVLASAKIVAGALKLLPVVPGDWTYSKDFDPSGRLKAFLTGQPYTSQTDAQGKAQNDRIQKLQADMQKAGYPFASVDALSNWLKQHWNDVPGKATTTSTASTPGTMSTATSDHRKRVREVRRAIPNVTLPSSKAQSDLVQRTAQPSGFSSSDALADWLKAHWTQPTTGPAKETEHIVRVRDDVRRQPQTVHHHHGDVNIEVKAAHDPKATGKAVREELEKLMQHSRSRHAAHAQYHTQPGVPRHQTVGW